ncbi:hypothetical protein IMZ48_23900 [Candidatus Bathyarchaeota archaeon]|nr:hypothetical protein [Candidatus Bathyarchaeota archaeon]
MARPPPSASGAQSAKMLAVPREALAAWPAPRDLSTPQCPSLERERTTVLSAPPIYPAVFDALHFPQKITTVPPASSPLSPSTRAVLCIVTLRGAPLNGTEGTLCSPMETAFLRAAIPDGGIPALRVEHPGSPG